MGAVGTERSGGLAPGEILDLCTGITAPVAGRYPQDAVGPHFTAECHGDRKVFAQGGKAESDGLKLSGGGIGVAGHIDDTDDFRGRVLLTKELNALDRAEVLAVTP